MGRGGNSSLLPWPGTPAGWEWEMVSNLNVEQIEDASLLKGSLLPFLSLLLHTSCFLPHLSEWYNP